MSEIELKVQKSIFSNEVLLKTLRAFSDDYLFEIIELEKEYLIRAEPQNGELIPKDLKHVFQKNLLDNQLREKISGETKEIRESIWKKAFL